MEKLIKKKATDQPSNQMTEEPMIQDIALQLLDKELDRELVKELEIHQQQYMEQAQDQDQDQDQVLEI
jgi:hypothetical protein